MVMFDTRTDAVLAAFAGGSFVDSLGGETVEDEEVFLARWMDRMNEAGTATAKLRRLHSRFPIEGTSVHPARWWRRQFKAAGFGALCGHVTVIDERPKYPIMLWRFADDWRSGLSFATDARYCHSATVAAGATSRGTLWCALVEPDSVLGVNWYEKAWRAGARPRWRTIDHPVHGPADYCG